jgi:hypothetical protein
VDLKGARPRQGRPHKKHPTGGNSMCHIDSHRSGLALITPCQSGHGTAILRELATPPAQPAGNNMSNTFGPLMKWPTR